MQGAAQRERQVRRSWKVVCSNLTTISDFEVQQAERKNKSATRNAPGWRVLSSREGKCMAARQMGWSVRVRIPPVKSAWRPTAEGEGGGRVPSPFPWETATTGYETKNHKRLKFWTFLLQLWTHTTMEKISLQTTAPDYIITKRQLTPIWWNLPLKWRWNTELYECSLFDFCLRPDMALTSNFIFIQYC